jgi:hypothetical protein
MSGSIPYSRVSRALLTDLEALALALIHRRWVARAALVSDTGEVLAICSGGDRVDTERATDRAGGIAPGAVIARIAVETLEEQSWIYVDLGGLRLLAALVRPAQAPTATAWIATELRRLGVTVEREPLAHG